MVSSVLNKCILLILILKCCGSISEKEADRHIRKLYNVLKKTVNEDKNNTRPYSLRRVLVGNSEYQIHISKLKEVNGFKMHNIVIRRPYADTTIYITNPLESKFPHAFMTLEEFKNAIIEQQLKNRELFEKSKSRMDNVLRSANEKSTTKFKFTSRAKFSNTTHKLVNPPKIKTKVGNTTTTSINVNNKNKTNLHVDNRSKSVTMKKLTHTKDTQTQTTKGKPSTKIFSSKNIPLRSTVVKNKSILSNVSSSFVLTNFKMSDKNTHSKVIMNKLTVNESLVSNDKNVETKVKVNPTEIVKVMVNTTKALEQGNNTVSVEPSKYVGDIKSVISHKTSPTLDKIVPFLNDNDKIRNSNTESGTANIDKGLFVDQDRKQMIDSNDDEKTVILKETPIGNVTELNHTPERENENNSGFLNKTNVDASNNPFSVEQGKSDGKSINDEELKAPEESVPEPTTTVASTTRDKWKKPRVFGGK